MNKELLLHNMENMGGCDRKNLLIGLIYANKQEVKELAEYIENNAEDFADHPGGGNDIESFAHYAKRELIFKELLSEVDSDLDLDYAGRFELDALRYKYSKGSEAKDIEEAHRLWLQARTQLVEAVTDKLNLTNRGLFHAIKEAKIKALIDLL